MRLKANLKDLRGEPMIKIKQNAKQVSLPSSVRNTNAKLFGTRPNYFLRLQSHEAQAIKGRRSLRKVRADGRSPEIIAFITDT